MNFLKRALLAVSRRKSKSVILFIIFAAIANLVLAGFAIQHATDSASNFARQQLGGELTLQYDIQKAMGEINTGGRGPRLIQSEPITEEMVNLIKSHENILDYNYIVGANGTAEGFKPVEMEEEETEASNTNGPKTNIIIGGAGNKNFVMPDVSVVGLLSTEYYSSFNDKSARLIEGEHITPEHNNKKVAVIEKNLAELNSLKVGSKIKISASQAEGIAEEYTIIGIYEAAEDPEAQGKGMNNISFMLPYNLIYTDCSSAIPLKTRVFEDENGNTETLEGGIDSAVFYVDDPKNIEKITEDIKKMDIDWEKFTLDANDDLYKQMMGPIESVASFSMMVVAIVAIAGAVILALILMLSIKERIYETGVLLSMGEAKFKVILQYVTEVIIIAIVAFSLSVYSGQLIAQEVGDSLLARNIAIAEEQTSQVFGPGGGFVKGGMVGPRGGRLIQQRMGIGSSFNKNAEPISSMKIEITPAEMAQTSGAGLLIIITATILPALTIMRYRPKTILTKAT